MNFNSIGTRARCESQFNCYFKPASRSIFFSITHHLIGFARTVAYRAINFVEILTNITGGGGRLPLSRNGISVTSYQESKRAAIIIALLFITDHSITGRHTRHHSGGREMRRPTSRNYRLCVTQTADNLHSSGVRVSLRCAVSSLSSVIFFPLPLLFFLYR